MIENVFLQSSFILQISWWLVGLGFKKYIKVMLSW